jgi:hypothetical protein
MVAKWTAVLILGGGLVAMGYWSAGAKAPQADIEVQLRARVATLEQRVAALEQTRSVDALQNTLSVAQAVASARERTITQDPAAHEAVADEQAEARSGKLDMSREAQQARADAYLAKFDETINSQPRNEAWSGPTLREARTTIISALPGARIIEERCGGDVCRIVVEHAAGDTESPRDKDLLSLPPFDQGSTVAYTPADGRNGARSRLYLQHTSQPVASTL